MARLSNSLLVLLLGSCFGSCLDVLIFRRSFFVLWFWNGSSRFQRFGGFWNNESFGLLFFGSLERQWFGTQTNGVSDEAQNCQDRYSHAYPLSNRNPDLQHRYRRRRKKEDFSPFLVFSTFETFQKITDMIFLAKLVIVLRSIYRRNGSGHAVWKSVGCLALGGLGIE